MPFFSVIIPVYNTSAYLHDCLDSILGQSFNDWECICVDDGSSDKSWDILSDYARKDNRFKVFHQENQGQSVARNYGIEKSEGVFFTFLDSDDLLLPNALQDWYNAINNQEIDVLVETGGFNSFYDIQDLDIASLMQSQGQEGRVLGNSQHALEYLFFESQVSGTTCGKVYRREKCRHLRFPTHLRYAEDSTFYLALFREELLWCVMTDSHYCYRRNRPGSHSLTISPAEKVDYFENSVDHLALLAEKGFSQSDCARFWERGIGNTMRYICGGPEECWNLLDTSSQERFRQTCKRAMRYLGYYPFGWTMRVRVEILRGHLEYLWRKFETLWYGLKRYANK